MYFDNPSYFFKLTLNKFSIYLLTFSQVSSNTTSICSCSSPSVTFLNPLRPHQSTSGPSLPLHSHFGRAQLRCVVKRERHGGQSLLGLLRKVLFLLLIHKDSCNFLFSYFFFFLLLNLFFSFFSSSSSFSFLSVFRPLCTL